MTHGSKGLLLLAFSAYVVTFLVTCTITRLIRAGRGPCHNLSQDDKHLHHSMPGLLLLVIGAFLAVGQQAYCPLNYMPGLLVGVGASPVLDECARIFHLQDMDWSQEGSPLPSPLLGSTSYPDLLGARTMSLRASEQRLFAVIAIPLAPLAVWLAQWISAGWIPQGDTAIIAEKMMEVFSAYPPMQGMRSTSTITAEGICGSPPRPDAVLPTRHPVCVGRVAAPRGFAAWAASSSPSRSGRRVG